jgi:hypothetical protein
VPLVHPFVFARHAVVRPLSSRRCRRLRTTQLRDGRCSPMAAARTSLNATSAMQAPPAPNAPPPPPAAPSVASAGKPPVPAVPGMKPPGLGGAGAAKLAAAMSLSCCTKPKHKSPAVTTANAGSADQLAGQRPRVQQQGHASVAGCFRLQDGQCLR